MLVALCRKNKAQGIRRLSTRAKRLNKPSENVSVIRNRFKKKTTKKKNS